MSGHRTSCAHLILKWRERDQSQPFHDINVMRLPASYREILEAARHQTCLIYVPKRGMAHRSDLCSAFIGSAVVAEIERPPGDTKILVHLANINLFPYPLKRQLNSFILETGDRFGRRDLSREQHFVREVEDEDFGRIMHLGMKGTLIGYGAAIGRSLMGDNPPTLAGFSEPPSQSDLIPARENISRIVRDPKVRAEVMALDAGRCALTGHCQIYRGKPTSIEVAHFFSLGDHGPDTVDNAFVMHVVLHQLYDRLAFTLADDFEVIWARDADPKVLAPGLETFPRALLRRPPNAMPDLRNIEHHRRLFSLHNR